MSEATTVRIGIDLGGTKIEIIALDARGETLLRRRVPTPVGEYDKTLSTITDLVHDAEASLGIRASVGVGAPGALSRHSGLVKNANSTVLIGKPLQRDLEARLERTIRLTNDANCFALSESIDGAAAGAHVTFGVILGTGVGGGIAIDGHVLEGANAIAGEWGHNPLPWRQFDEIPGPPCYCGKTGCLETFLSGPALARQYHERTGTTLSTMEIALHAQAGESDALAVFSRYEDRLARGLATIINVLDPDIIVFGGGMSNVERLYASLEELLAQYVFSQEIVTRLVRARHGDSSGVRGAAMLWP